MTTEQRRAADVMKRGSGIVARLVVTHRHECAKGFDTESGTWTGNHAVEGDVWRCGDCGATYVWHGPHEEFPRHVTGGWLPATKKELQAIETGEEVEFRER